MGAITPLPFPPLKLQACDSLPEIIRVRDRETHTYTNGQNQWNQCTALHYDSGLVHCCACLSPNNAVPLEIQELALLLNLLLLMCTNFLIRSIESFNIYVSMALWPYKSDYHRCEMCMLLFLLNAPHLQKHGSTTGKQLNNFIS